MGYEEFVAFIKEKVSQTVGKEGYVAVNKIMKNNGVELDGIVIMNTNRILSPTIYLNEFYEKYQAGISTDNIVDEIISLHNENSCTLKIDPDFFKSFEKIKPYIAYKIVNYEQNKKLLEKVPYKNFLDLAIVFYLSLEMDNGENVSALIYNSHLETWGTDKATIYKIAKENTPKLLGCDFRNMKEILCEVFAEQMQDEEFADFIRDSDRQVPMYILTNKKRTNGAIAMLYRNVLKEFANDIKKDLYILPSSVHEVIVIPKEEDMDSETLTKMVREVNQEEVSETEVLSDSVYIYDKENDEIKIAE